LLFGCAVAEALAHKGALGRFATDFVSVPDGHGKYTHYAIEVNLRKGGTTHPFLTLRFLTDGSYDASTGEFLAQNGTPKYYFASDTLQNDAYKGLMPDDLIDIEVRFGKDISGAAAHGGHLHGITSSHFK
jgi:hypothetical protein